jgi:hypothetical protein
VVSMALGNLKHIVVVIMKGRSFRPPVRSLKKVDPRIIGLTSDQIEPRPFRRTPAVSFAGRRAALPCRPRTASGLGSQE